MGGTTTKKSASYYKFRAEIKDKFQNQDPVNWPQKFYEIPFLFFFADFFRAICNVGAFEDRNLIMENLKPLFLWMEEELKKTARSLSKYRPEEDLKRTLRNMSAALACWEKVDDIISTQEAIICGYAVEWFLEGDAMKRIHEPESRTISNNINHGNTTATREMHSSTNQTNLGAKGAETTKVRKVKIPQKTQPQQRTQRPESTEHKQTDQQHANMRLSTGPSSQMRNMRQRLREQNPQPSRAPPGMNHQPQQVSPQRTGQAPRSSSTVITVPHTQNAASEAPNRRLESRQQKNFRSSLSHPSLSPRPDLYMTSAVGHDTEAPPTRGRGSRSNDQWPLRHSVNLDLQASSH